MKTVRSVFFAFMVFLLDGYCVFSYFLFKRIFLVWGYPLFPVSEICFTYYIFIVILGIWMQKYVMDWKVLYDSMS